MLALRSLKQAVEALKIAFEIYDHNLLEEFMPEKIVLRDGVIQRFEFTFELSWKMLKRYLEEFGLEKVDGLNNRDLFRVGFEQGLLDDPEAWFHYLRCAINPAKFMMPAKPLPFLHRQGSFNWRRRNC